MSLSNRSQSNAANGTERRPLNILLAEDNLTNQKLAVAILEKQGHTVSVASDGRQAIDAYENGSYDIVLMDMQMPEVDGLEATIAIRSFEKSSGRRTPIVALTANAMIGDRERCINAGMDDYLSKPLRADELITLIEKMASQSLTATAVTTPAAPANTRPADDVFNYAASVQQVGDDPELLSQLVVVFLDQLPRLLPPLESAVAAGDAKAIRQTAHALCSSVSVIAATRAKDVARKMEMIGLNADLTHAAETHAEVLAEFRTLQDALNNTPELKAA